MENTTTAQPTTEITNSDIRSLAIEAANHGDDEMVRDCNRALNGVRAAWRRVERIILDARVEAAYQDDLDAQDAP